MTGAPTLTAEYFQAKVARGGLSVLKVDELLKYEIDCTVRIQRILSKLNK